MDATTQGVNFRSDRSNERAGVIAGALCKLLLPKDYEVLLNRLRNSTSKPEPSTARPKAMSNNQLPQSQNGRMSWLSLFLLRIHAAIFLHPS